MVWAGFYWIGRVLNCDWAGNCQSDLATLLAAHYNTALSLSLDSLAPLKTHSVSFISPATWYTTKLCFMKASGHQLERLYKRSGLTVHLKAYKDHVKSYKEALSKTKRQYYCSLIGSQQNHPRMLFSTINRLLCFIEPHHPPGDPDRSSKFLDFFQTKVNSIQLLVSAPLPSHIPASSLLTCLTACSSPSCLWMPS